MKKTNIILSATIILLCLAVIYIFNIRGSYLDLNGKLELQQKEIKDLTFKLRQAKEVSDKRRIRIEQLASGYPTGIWECDNNADGIVFKQEINDPVLDEIITNLNEIYRSHKEPTIIFLKQDKNNVHLTVNDPEELAERMGSAGARCYLGEVVYSITSIDEINRVIFEFEEGSHAVPGKYSRMDFEH